MLLIDEIDKAEPDFPNNLLVPLGSHQVVMLEEIAKVIMLREPGTIIMLGEHTAGHYHI